MNYYTPLIFHYTVATARALREHNIGACFDYALASPVYDIDKDANLQTETAHECQALCRNMDGCKVFQWMPGSCRLKDATPKWTRYEWYILPNSITGPPICTGKIK